MKEIEPIGPPDSHFFNAAMGWLELGDWREALAELEKMAPQWREHPAVLAVRCDILSKGQKWDCLAPVAEALTKLQPDEAGWWIQWAYATRRMADGGIPQAREILMRAHEQFPKEALICYNLACYDCQTGELKAAEKWLQQSFALGDPTKLNLMALNDSDLKPLWATTQE